MSIVYRVSAVFVSLLFVTACGFHLRGGVELPDSVQPIWVSGEQQSFVQEFKRQLENYGNVVADKGSNANTEIKILSEKQSQRQLSVAQDGYTREYELTLTVVYQIIRGDGTILSNQKLSLSRNYDYQSDSATDFVVGKAQEREVLVNEMRRELAGKLMYRLQRALSQN